MFVFVTRKLNPVIKGEDCVLLIFKFENNIVGIWDSNRYNESNAEDPRYTFGEFLVEGDNGSIRLDGDSKITIQKLGEKETEHDYFREHRNFSGDCVYFCQKHFVDCMLNNKPFETGLEMYLENIKSKLCRC